MYVPTVTVYIIGYDVLRKLTIETSRISIIFFVPTHKKNSSHQLFFSVLHHWSPLFSLPALSLSLLHL